MTRALLIEAWTMVLAFRLGLWLLPWRVVARVPRLRQRTGPVSATEAARAVQAVARFVPAATCLTHALALRALLARRGCESVLTLGVRNPPAGALQAHAWLQVGGRIVLGNPGAVQYEPLHPATQGAPRNRDR